MINIQKKYIYFIQIKYLWQIKSSLSKVINWKERNSHNSSVLKEFYDRKYMDRSHGGGDHFLANTQFFKNCNFSSEIKYFSTKQLLSVINTICKKNIQKL